MKKSEFGRLGLRPLQRLGLRPSHGTGGVPSPPAGWAYVFRPDGAGGNQIVFRTDALGVSRPLVARLAS